MSKRKSKWIVFATYNASGIDHIVFVRKNFRSGILEFKDKRISPLGVCSYNMNSIKSINPNDQLQTAIMINQ